MDPLLSKTLCGKQSLFSIANNMTFPLALWIEGEMYYPLKEVEVPKVSLLKHGYEVI